MVPFKPRAINAFMFLESAIRLADSKTELFSSSLSNCVQIFVLQTKRKPLFYVYQPQSTITHIKSFSPQRHSQTNTIKTNSLFRLLQISITYNSVFPVFSQFFQTSLLTAPAIFRKQVKRTVGKAVNCPRVFYFF